MKKIIATCAVAVLGVVALSSCGKEYSCNCTDGITTSVETHKGSDATEACNDATTVIPLKVCTPV
ncbi:MAG: hypothetical protein QNK23_13445 [Crocinitomicaceae bacterium]|nr:hypothetical protein [Crocinitomicaceae bacterium]